eukprot:jgi/Mesvir1/24385/Mv11054-RA.1
MSCCGWSTRNQRYVYFALFLVTVTLAWVIRDFGHGFLGEVKAFPNKCETDTCLGKEGVLRISMGSFLFFFLLCLLCIGVNDLDHPRARLDSGCWPLKFVLWAVLIIVPFFMPASVIQAYGECARFGSGLFLLMQVVLLIDFIYKWNNDWGSRQGCMVVMVATTILLYGAGITLTVFMYIWFAPHADCRLNILYISLGLSLMPVYTLISIMARVERAGLMTSGAVFLYTCYLAASAIMSEPTDEGTDTSRCNTLPRQTDRKNDWPQIVSFVLALLYICISTVRSGVTSAAFTTHPNKYDSDDSPPYNYSFFHFTFAVASMYFAMLFTSWSLDETSEEYVAHAVVQYASIRCCDTTTFRRSTWSHAPYLPCTTYNHLFVKVCYY